MPSVLVESDYMLVLFSIAGTLFKVDDDSHLTFVNVSRFVKYYGTSNFSFGSNVGSTEVKLCK